MSQKSDLTNLASEFYVLSLLTRLGHKACLTLGNKKQVDIVIDEDDCATTVDVKAVANKDDWFADSLGSHESKNYFIVLVSYEGHFQKTDQLPKVWVIPAHAISQFAKTTVKENKETCCVNRKLILENGKHYENAWYLLKREKGLVGEALAIAHRSAALPVFDHRSEHEILGYDEHGIPAQGTDFSLTDIAVATLPRIR